MNVEVKILTGVTKSYHTVNLVTVAKKQNLQFHVKSSKTLQNNPFNKSVSFRNFSGFLHKLEDFVDNSSERRPKQTAKEQLRSHISVVELHQINHKTFDASNFDSERKLLLKTYSISSQII